MRHAITKIGSKSAGSKSRGDGHRVGERSASMNGPFPACPFVGVEGQENCALVRVMAHHFPDAEVEVPNEVVLQHHECAGARFSRRKQDCSWRGAGGRSHYV